ncbi:hypothetical protein PENTCL1PPCAC_8382 [Pristionchus entomophagus]|uniref:Uncharacterized protein n=1 Tax=Pristionchus entomophagus TaxID=358040 RepID=A0AAV5SUW2_9BILA|nr:hypothetical protein PENTCL1PPCAC_8382 [Pristionchus entomophagus]
MKVVMTSQFPDGYFERRSNENAVGVTNSASVERRNGGPKDERKEINKSAKELLNSQSIVAKLTQEVERIKSHNDELEISAVEVFEENKELKRRLNEMSNALKKSEEKAERAHLKCMELEQLVETIKIEQQECAASVMKNAHSLGDKNKSKGVTGANQSEKIKKVRSNRTLQSCSQAALIVLIKCFKPVFSQGNNRNSHNPKIDKQLDQLDQHA